VLQALRLFQRCDDYRKVPRAVQTLTAALAQQVGLALRSTSVPESLCQPASMREEHDAQKQ